VFITPLEACIKEATALGTKEIEGTIFAVENKENIMVTHPNPAVLEAFEGFFGSKLDNGTG
jgi:hypothetical protein